MSGRTGDGLKAWHVGAALGAAFAVVLGVNGAFVWIALGTFPGEDVPRAYLQGLDYNATLEDRARARALGWAASASLEDTPGGLRLVMAFTDAEGIGLDGLDVAGTLRHPADAGRDRALAFAPLGGGRYAASLEGAAPGSWEVVAAATDRAGHRFEARKEIWWR